MRRCQEDLVPSPEHPGCIYGEMAMCLRPCQQVVGPAEYATEMARVVEFLRTDGQSLLECHRPLARSPERRDAVRGRGAAAQALRKSAGGAATARRTGARRGPAERRRDHTLAGADAVEMWFVRDGWWQEPQRFGFEVQRRQARLARPPAARDASPPSRPRKLTVRERQEYLALLARWYYSTWREGEWLGFESYDDIPYRKLVNAVSRVARRDSGI